MIVLKTLLSEGSRFHHHHCKPVHSQESKEPSGASARHLQNSLRIDRLTSATTASRKMEFMYCIPDLEHFIDKTIKKCLLEYDLDANDTEAVLDDMEKAWPKSPPRPSEKQVLKDCNDNTDTGPASTTSSSLASPHGESPAGDKGMLDKPGLKAGDVKPSNDKAKGEDRVADWIRAKGAGLGNAVTNGRREEQRQREEETRSGSSSPDLDGKQLTRRHPKLKSRLQERYFEERQSSDDSPDRKKSKQEDRQEDRWGDSQRHSNLDLLASAANIHPESSKPGQEYTEAVRKLQADSARHLQEDFARRSAVAATRDLAGPSVAQSHKEMPQLVRLMAAPAPSATSSTSLSLTPSSGQREESGRTNSPDSVTALPVSAPSRDERPMNGRPGEPHGHSSGDRARLLQQHYQNGYHAVIPRERETVVIVRESPVGKVEKKQGTISCLPSWMNHVEKESTLAHLHHFMPSSSAPFPPRQPLSPAPLETCHDHSHLHHQSSRIATIIAEELQKDNDCNHEPLASSPHHHHHHHHHHHPNHHQHHSSATSSYHNHQHHQHHNTSSSSIKPTGSQFYDSPATRPNGHRHVVCKPPVQLPNLSTNSRGGPDNIPMSALQEISQVKHHHVMPSHAQQVGQAQLSTRPVLSSPSSSSNADALPGPAGGPGEPVAYRQLPQLLPAHLVPSTRAGVSVLQSHTRGHGGSADIYRASPRSDLDDQPQDLSTRPRKTMSDEGVVQARPELYTTNPDSPLTDRGKAGYFSSPNSPLAIPTPVRHVESPASRKSASPSNNSDKECDYNSGNDVTNTPLRTSGKWERRGQVHGLDILPGGSKDSKQLAERRRAEALRRWSESREEETNKRRELK